MSSAIVQDGSRIALVARESSGRCVERVPTPSTLSDLLAALDGDPTRSSPMLRSTVSKVAEFHNLPLQEITLDRVFERRGEFRPYLESRTYAENSIRSYVNYARILIQKARNFGWRPYQNLPREWQQVVALAPKHGCSDIARSLALLRRTPKEVTTDDVDTWAENALKGGVRGRLVNRKKGRFWRLLRECGMTSYIPLSAVRAQVYKVPFEQFPQQLKLEVEQLLRW